MQVAHGKDVTIVLTPRETRLMRYALERALFIDTPALEQEAIATFCSRALDLLKGEGSEA
jgi:hypothetical protein